MLLVKKGANATFYLIFPGLGFIIISTCFPPQHKLVDRKHSNDTGVNMFWLFFSHDVHHLDPLFAVTICCVGSVQYRSNPVNLSWIMQIMRPPLGSNMSQIIQIINLSALKYLVQVGIDGLSEVSSFCTKHN